MDVKTIELILKAALEKPEDIDLTGKYGSAIAEYLKGNKSTNELISIVVQGIDIDNAANFFDYLSSINKNNLQQVIKQVKENPEVKKNTNNNGVKFVSGMLAMAFMHEGELASQGGSIIAILISLISAQHEKNDLSTLKAVMLEYLISSIDETATFPEWGVLKTPAEGNLMLAEIIVDLTEDSDSANYTRLRRWATEGIKNAKEKIKIASIEAKIPESKIGQLKAILDHYKNVEEQMRKAVYDNARLENQLEKDEAEISLLNAEVVSLREQIKSMKTEIETKHSKIEEMKNEVGQRKAINDAFDALKQNDEKALLNDIAWELRAEYADFKESEEDEIDAVLGEIYREKIRNIFRILSKFGIVMR